MNNLKDELLKYDILKYSRQENLGKLSTWFDKELEYQLLNGQYPNEWDLAQLRDNIVLQLKAYSKTYNINNVAIGMSGGVDSALTAALFKEAGWNVTGVTMPIHQNPEETDRGIETINVLGLEHVHVDLTQTYDDLLDSVRVWDNKIDDADHTIRRANLRVRLRMMTVYNVASSIKGLVGSTDNFSELAAGFWTLHGDVGDVAPIQCLTKSWEVPKLAEMMGVPASTVFATPTDGLGISQSDEHQFGFSYLELDLVLLALVQKYNIEIFIPDSREDIINELGASESSDKVNKILDRIKGSTFKRSNPYNLKHLTHNFRYSGLANIDRDLWSFK